MSCVDGWESLAWREDPGTGFAGKLCPLSKLKRTLSRDELLALLEFSHLVCKAVLHFGLEMAGEAISQNRVHTPHIVVPRSFAAGPVIDIAVELLVPAQRPVKVRRKLVLGFHVINQCVRIADIRHLEAGQEQLGP